MNNKNLLELIEIYEDTIEKQMETIEQLAKISKKMSETIRLLQNDAEHDRV